MPASSPDISYQPGDYNSALKELVRGIPKEVAVEAGQYVARAIGARIKYQSEDARGQELDPVEPITDRIKADEGQQTGRALVATGQLTDWGAFDVLVNGDTISLVLKGQHHEKWDNIIEIAQRTGKNWDYAFDLSETEVNVALFAIIRWINEQLGIDTFEAGDMNVPEVEQYYGK